MPTPNHETIAARVTGILVFAAGIAILAFVFFTARGLFDAPLPRLADRRPAEGVAAAPSAATEIGRSLTQFVRQLLLLLLMCVAGSVIASKGIQLYFAAAQAPGGPGHAPRGADPVPAAAPAAAERSPAQQQPPPPPSPTPAQKTKTPQ
jgi:hypothetical protein